MQVGNIVKFKENVTGDRNFDGYYRITSMRGGNVNLSGPFGKTIYHKRVPLTLLQECETEWYDMWSKSETYMCM